MIDGVQGYYGFTRIAWCINNRAIGVLTGEVGSGKTVPSRAPSPLWTRPGSR